MFMFILSQASHNIVHVNTDGVLRRKALRIKSLRIFQGIIGENIASKIKAQPKSAEG
jgi:hypothetical protein